MNCAGSVLDMTTDTDTIRVRLAELLIWTAIASDLSENLSSELCDDREDHSLSALVRQAEQGLSDRHWHVYSLLASKEYWQSPDLGWMDWRDTKALLSLTAEDRAKLIIEVFKSD